MRLSSMYTTSQQLPLWNLARGPLKSVTSNNLRIPTQMSMPTLQSSTMVAQYHRHGSFYCFVDSDREIATLRKWASSWETACFEVSRHQIRHARFGCYLYRLQTSTAKESRPSMIWTSTPNHPNSQHSTCCSAIFVLKYCMYRKVQTRPLPDPLDDDPSADLYELLNQPSTQGSSPSPNAPPDPTPRQILNLRCKNSRLRRKEQQAHLNSRIEQLERQIESFRKTQGLCRRCSQLLTACPHFQESSDPVQLGFHEFELGRKGVSELKGQMWMVAGIIMIIMGLNLYGLNGSVEIYKVTHQQFTKLAEQVSQPKQDIEFSLYYQSVFSNNSTGVQIATVESADIMFEERLDISLRYDSLILMMDNVKEMLCFSSWLSV